MFLTLFLQGAEPPVIPPAYGIFFYNPFLDLSLISRFPIYMGFPAIRVNRLSVRTPNNILFQIMPCDTVAQ